MERRQYIPVGLTAASMRPTSMQKTSPDRNCSVTHLCKSQLATHPVFHWECCDYGKPRLANEMSRAGKLSHMKLFCWYCLRGHRAG